MTDYGRPPSGRATAAEPVVSALRDGIPDALKPCPFCGNSELAIGFTRATDTFAFWSVECPKCGVEVADDESQQAASDHWNRREGEALMTPRTIAATSALDITNADHIALWLEENLPGASLPWLAVQIVEAHEAVLRDPPAHRYWAAGEPDCPPDIKARNGELHTLRCRKCGNEDADNRICLPAQH